MLDKNLKTARQITIHAKIAGPILKLSKIFLLHYLADSYYTEIKKESSIDRFMCAYSYEFFCLPVSFFSFKSTFSVSLVLPSLHLCKNHKTLDLIMILQHNLTSKMVTQLSNQYSTWCNGITRFRWSNQWEIQQKLSTKPDSWSAILIHKSWPSLHLWDAEKVDTLWCCPLLAHETPMLKLNPFPCT